LSGEAAPKNGIGRFRAALAGQLRLIWRQFDTLRGSLALMSILVVAGLVSVGSLFLVRNGVLTVTIENRLDRSLVHGLVIRNGHRPSPLTGAFREIAPHREVSGTFRHWSGDEVEFEYDIVGVGTRKVYCGYPDWGSDVDVRIVAEGDSLRSVNAPARTRRD